MRWKKLVVRNLPHDLTCEEALGLCGYPVDHTCLEDKEVDGMNGKTLVDACPYFFRYDQGKSAKNGREAMPSRLYLQFRKEPDALPVVKATLHGKNISTANGVSFVLEVDIAPNQKLPRDKRRRDNKANTLERDPDFIAFLEELNDTEKKPLPVASEGDEVEKPVAALVKFLNERRSKGKFRGTSTSFPASGRKKKGNATSGQKSKKKTKDATSESKASGGQKKPRERRRNDPAEEPKSDIQPGMLRIMPKVAAASQPFVPPPPPPSEPASLLLNPQSASFEMPNAEESSQGGRGSRGGRGGRGKKPKSDNGGRGSGNNGGRGNGGGRGQGKKKVYAPRNPLPSPPRP